MPRFCHSPISGLPIFFILFFACTGVSAQTVARYPAPYLNPNGKVLAEVKSSNRIDAYWVVYSDRDNNPAYPTPNPTAATISLRKFMEPMYVVGETADYLQVVKYDPTALKLNSSPANNKLKPEATEEIGWMPKAKLLCWEWGTVNGNGFRIKALTVHNPSALKNPESYSASQSIKLFNDPSLAPSSRNRNELALFQFLFVYKQEGNALLIGRREKVNLNNPDREVLGWINKSSIQIWDQRVCLQPDVSVSNAEERKQKNIKAAVFPTNGDAVAYAVSHNPAADIWNGDKFSTALPGQWIRMPILEDIPAQKVYRTAFVTDIYNRYGDPALTNDEYVKISAKANNQYLTARKVNLVFVVDGGESMSPYFQPLINAIANNIEFLKASNNSYRMGAVVYRDYTEEKCGGANRLVESKELTTDYKDILGFLNIAQTNAKDCNDNQKPQAVYMGLKRALTLISSDAEAKKQTNIIILVGGAGNHLNDKRADQGQIIDLMATYNCGLLAYQVNQSADDVLPYRNFRNQAVQIMNASAQKMVAGTEYKPQLEGPATDGSALKFSFDFPKTSPVPGIVVFPDVGQRLETAFLEGELTQLIQKIDGDNENLFADIDRIINGQGAKNTQLNAQILLMLKKAGIDMADPNVRKMLAADNFQFFIEGAVPYTVSGLASPPFKKVLFLTSSEFTATEAMFDKLANSGNSSASEIRERLKDNYINLVKGVLGSDVSEGKIEKMSPDSIHRLVTNFPLSTSILDKSIRLDDFDNPRKVTDAKLQELISLYNNKLLAFRKVKYNESQYRFVNGDDFYYWVPEEALP